MVIDFNVDCNCYNKKILENYSVFDYICPKCGAKHSFIRHGTYERNVFFVDSSKNLTEEKIDILRLKCTSCNSTHAILPNDIIPYCIYSFSFILNVLIEYYSTNHKILNLCSNFHISFQIIYTFISKFTVFLDSCVAVLRSLGYSITSTYSVDTIVSAINIFQLSENFLYQYFFNSQWMVLMLKFKNILPRPIFISGFS